LSFVFGTQPIFIDSGSPRHPVEYIISSGRAGSDVLLTAGMWKIVLCYIVLLLMLSVPLHFESDLVDHFTILQHSRAERWEDNTFSHRPVDEPQAHKYHDSPLRRAYTEDTHAAPAIAPPVDPSFVQEVMYFAVHAPSVLGRLYMKVFGGLVWTLLMKLYLQGPSFWDGKLGFWNGQTEAQICGHLRAYHDKTLWENAGQKCHKMVFDQLNGFMVMFHCAIIGIVAGTCLKHLSWRYNDESARARTLAEIRMVVSNEMFVALSSPRHRQSPSP
jgi:hypothetical protein